MPPDAQRNVHPTRAGRMAGVNITIDGETWAYVLQAAGIPTDAPLTELRVTRYRTRKAGIILKVAWEGKAREGAACEPGSAVGTDAATEPEGPRMPGISDYVIRTEEG